MTMDDERTLAPTSRPLGLDETAAVAAAACLFSALGEPSRLAILRHLLLGEHTVGELTEHLGLAQSTVSKHLSCLRDCGLVISRAVGRSSVISLSQPEALTHLLAAGEEMLTATGDAATHCRTVSRSRR